MIPENLPAWFADAACIDQVDLFFSRKMSEQKQARQICLSCDFLPQCSEIEPDSQWGVWAGLLPHERKKELA